METLVSDVLPSVRWDEQQVWTVTEPVLLFDSVCAGADVAGEEHLRIVLEHGDYLVGAAYASPPDAYLILVRLTRRG